MTQENIKSIKKNSVIRHTIAGRAMSYVVLYVCETFMLLKLNTLSTPLQIRFDNVEFMDRAEVVA